jgi:phosphoglycolate phosphatase-like HAD superfamily hydrolase
MTDDRILALDFDGVLCDGMLEYWQTAWLTYLEVWQLPPTPPPEVGFEGFARSRSTIEYGWEMPVLVRALAMGISVEAITDHWPQIRDRLLEEDGILAAQLRQTLDVIRDRWIATDRSSWLACHRFYPGIPQFLQSLGRRSIQPMIITTKEGRFVAELLAGIELEIDPKYIWGKEINRSKADSLKYILDNWPTQIDRLWFIEDRLPTLLTISDRPDLNRVQLYLADWGYNTELERNLAQDSDQIALLTLDTIDGMIA